MAHGTNRLGLATSPYLLQHAHNPVDWYPWGDEAFERAAREDKPIFLSVGYAACHWCHVMERESFEDEETADLLNARFVSVKVDREERPDVDSIYMDAVQAMSDGHGGWPMSVFLTPAGEPFYAGTYFPKEPRFGAPSFRQVLVGIADAWDNRRDDVLTQGSRVTAAIGATSQLRASPEELDAHVLERAFTTLASASDARWGGFGGAPKFPQPMTLEFVLRMALRDAPGAIDMVTSTLDRMAAGGIRDQLSGGFARYAVDATWHVPHFEKMLYDNAQLAQLYTHAWLVTHDDRHQEVAVGILEELLRDMRRPGGGFSSSQDADSGGVEGAHATWSWDELVRLVGEPVAIAFGGTPEGNWERDPGDRTNVLWHPVPIAAVAADLGIDAETLRSDVARARRILVDVRRERPAPAIDDKVVTAWNALAIAAFAEAGRAFGIDRYVDAARDCARFLLEHLHDDRGRLLRSWRDGRASVPAFADDHALLAAALLTLYETTGDPAWFAAARRNGDRTLELFHDDERGGFFQTGADAEKLVTRPKELYDNATPSGNSAAANALLRLGMFTGDPRYEDAAVSAIRLVAGIAAKAPSAFGHALCALDLLLGPRREIAIVGERSDAATRSLLDTVASRFRPHVVLARSDGDGRGDDVPLLEGRTLVEGRPAAYVCERFACRMPVSEPDALERLLDVGS